MSEVRWRPVHQGGHLYSHIVAQIRQLIEDQALRPGDQLPPERELAQRLGVSRASVREAVKTLEARGYLDVRHGRGVSVRAREPMGDTLRAELAGREVGLRDLFAMREVLEVPAAGWAAAGAGPGQVAELDGKVEELVHQATRDAPDFATLRRLDAGLHLHIAEVAGNPFLWRTMGVLHEMLNASMETTLVIPGRLARSARDHRRILKAIAAADSQGARRAMRDHIRGAEAAAMARLAAEDGHLR
ncbi:MAG TPA: FadR/GntR family transcriptional regulator [Acidimicrobiales bacterium]|nr:FadR/GntR family transcriptional regulator [Acidimicrobiales bacterium]